MDATFVAVLKKISWAGFLGTSSVFAFNSTEHLRMARKIQLGKVSVEMEKELPDPAYCQIPPGDIIQALERAPYRLHGIIGPKSTGKTSTVQLVARDLPNVVHVEMTAAEDVCDVLYRRLKRSVFHFPWFLNSLRLDSGLDSKMKVAKVFRMVEKNTKKPVTTVIQILPAPSSYHLPKVRSPEDALEEVLLSTKGSMLPTSAENSFIRQIKLLVSDRNIMRCLFDSSEGGQFERIGEPRLRLYRTSELPWPLAVKYLTEKFDVVVDAEVKEYLRKLPRRFEELRLFAECVDRKAFVDNVFESCVSQIEASLKYPSAKEVYYKLLQNGKIRVSEYTCSTAEFEKVFLKTNILSGDRSGDYHFQFDATAEAARQICKL
eukprot:Em0017g163a